MYLRIDVRKTKRAETKGVFLEVPATREQYVRNSAQWNT